MTIADSAPLNGALVDPNASTDGDGEELPIEQDAVFGEGWRAAEQKDGRVAWRWTAGVARLSPGARVVLVDFAGFGHYWREQDDGGLALSA